MYTKHSLVRFFLKSAAFLGLIGIFYVYYFTDVIQKYSHGFTNIIFTTERVKNGTKPPFLTMCMTPRAKLSILENYNLSLGALNEPNTFELKIMKNLNLTIEDLFREVTFQLNVDFYLHMVWWVYDENGWEEYRSKLFEGIDNIIMVSLLMDTDQVSGNP